MSRLEKQGKENLRIQLIEKQIEDEKMARLRESAKHETCFNTTQTQIVQQQSDTKDSH